jgi:hypothetical protein
MPDIYTQQKLAIQGQFSIGSLADYTGQRKALHGTVKIVAHERKGGVVIECDGVRALVSPFALTPVAAIRPPGAGKGPENGALRMPSRSRPTTTIRATSEPQQPTAKIIRNGIALVPDRAVGPAILLDRLRQIGQPPASVAPTLQAPPPPSLNAPLGRANVERFFAGWLKAFRRDTTHPMRQVVIDGFADLPAYLRDRLPPEPGLHYYRMCVYYIAAVELADPSRLPPPAEIPPLVSARFRVRAEAVAIHLKWMRARLAADHAAFAAKLREPAPVGVTP